MIEEVSYPPDLATWKPNVHPFFYLELFGETSPQLDMKYAEVLPAGPIDGQESTVTAIPIYQYWWTIGHSEEVHDMCSQLPDPAAYVYLYFPLSGGWRIKELVATVKYLTPVPQHTDWFNKVADAFHATSPLIDDASKLAALIPNPAIAGVAPILSTIAKLQINTIPPVDGFKWWISKVTRQTKEFGVVQGVKWTLPKQMFTDLGDRLTGSIALSFIPSQVQQSENVSDNPPKFEKQPILANVRINIPHEENKQIYVPDKEEFTKLYVAPRQQNAQ